MDQIKIGSGPLVVHPCHKVWPDCNDNQKYIQTKAFDGNAIRYYVRHAITMDVTFNDDRTPVHVFDLSLLIRRTSLGTRKLTTRSNLRLATYLRVCRQQQYLFTLARALIGHRCLGKFTKGFRCFRCTAYVRGAANRPGYIYSGTVRRAEQ